MDEDRKATTATTVMFSGNVPVKAHDSAIEGNVVLCVGELIIAGPRKTIGDLIDDAALALSQLARTRREDAA